jgi:uncharacterized protein with FMN-binding domain
MNTRQVLAAGAAAAALAGCTATSDEQPRSTSTFRDGTYSAEGEYGGLPSHIGVTVTLDDGVITDVDVATRATDPTSLDLQQRFAAAVPDVAVGRPIADLEVDKLAGSSGTPVGFNDALDQIRGQATSPAPR